ncbi:Uncharacterised protein [Slackia heliotrinireducens]|nr:Uncharacterised protein [Slackia heliotrinireducens]
MAGKVDEYVKFQARDTIRRNAARDRNARYARIPDGKACDFCRMLGSRGFVYHSEASAGGDDQYHPFCNCQLAVCFDPFVEEYWVGTVKVTRGHGDGEVVRAGRDGSMRMRDVDVDGLYDEYRRMGQDFNKGSRYRDYSKTGRNDDRGRGARLSDEEFDAAMKRLADCTSLEELHRVGAEIVREWKPNGHGRNNAQWDEMSRHARELERRFAGSGNTRRFDPEYQLEILHERADKKSNRANRGAKVDMDAIDSEDYRALFDRIGNSELAENLCEKAREFLRHRSGTVFEDFGLFGVKGGVVYDTITTVSTPHAVELTRKSKLLMNTSKPRSLVAMHTHPDSMPPSAADFLTSFAPSVRFGVIANHDGSLVKYEVVDRSKFLGIFEEGKIQEIDDLFADMLDEYGTSTGDRNINEILERRYGVKYERFRV